MATHTDKIYVTAEDLLQDSYRLAVNIYQSGYRPNFIVGLWRGGSGVGIAVQECLEYLGVQTDHIAIRTSYSGMESYAKMIDSDRPPRVHGLQYLLENLDADDALLIVDDAYGSGKSIQAVIETLANKTKRNMPNDLRVAAPWYKPSQRQVERVPDYYLHETDRWIVFPYELTGLTLAEIAKNKPGVAPIIARLASTITKPK